MSFRFFYFNYTATTEIYTLSLHDALPIYTVKGRAVVNARLCQTKEVAHVIRRAIGEELHHDAAHRGLDRRLIRSEEHTSELQSLAYLVCRLLLEKKKTIEEHISIHRSIFV